MKGLDEIVEENKKADELAYKQIANEVSGKIHCPQCKNLLSQEQVEITNGFVYCKLCNYLITRGD